MHKYVNYYHQEKKKKICLKLQNHQVPPQETEMIGIMIGISSIIIQTINCHTHLIDEPRVQARKISLTFNAYSFNNL